MKTEKQIEAKLEDIVKRFEVIVGEIDASKGATEDQKAAVMASFGSLALLGWVLDCEAELAGLMRTLKIASAMQTADTIMKPKPKEAT